MKISEYEFDALKHEIERLRSDVRDLEYKVQQLDYYKADDKHTHPEYDRR